MILQTTFHEQTYFINTDEAISIAISVQFDAEQPNHFGADKATKKPLTAGNFIGNTTRGGSCNVDSITMVPHCNGTHTETVSHIVHQQFNVGDLINETFSTCLLITVSPIEASKTSDNYLPELSTTDQVIDLKTLKNSINEKQLNNIDSLVIRTQPNTKEKRHYVYDQDHQPPFFTHEAINWLSQSNIKHLLVDFPSIDKMYDDGLLSNHHIFWQVEPQSRLINDLTKTNRTITEMIYVENDVDDGLYCLDLQVPSFALDAAPSRPILYPLHHLTSTDKSHI